MLKKILAGQACADDAANYDDRTFSLQLLLMQHYYIVLVVVKLTVLVLVLTRPINVTFSVNTANIEVGANGMYAGGGAFFGGRSWLLL